MDETETKPKSVDELYNYLSSEIPSGVVDELTSRLVEENQAYVRVDYAEILNMDDSQLKEVYATKGAEYVKEGIIKITKARTYRLLAKELGMEDEFLEHPSSATILIKMYSSMAGKNIDEIIDKEVSKLMQLIKEGD